MRSEIKLVSPGLKVSVVIGLFLTVIVIFFGLAYRFEFSVILLTVAGSIGSVALVFITGKALTLLFDVRIRQQELRLITYQADRAGLERYVLHFSRNERIVTPVDAPIRVIEALSPIEGPALALPASTSPVDLLAALDSVQRCLIVGASDTGKTTLLQWLVSRRSNTSKVIVIDPHAYPGKYPNCDIIGLGRNYDEIGRALGALIQLMTKRYDEIGKGLVRELAHDRVTILIDEWRAITGNLGKPAEEAIKALLTESRKAAFSVFVASHSDRAKPLGLSGEYDLKDGFTIVRLAIIEGQRQATIDHGNGEIPASTSPAWEYSGAAYGAEYSQPGQGLQGLSTLRLDHNFQLDLEPEPSPAEATVLELLDRGESLKTISESVWGPGKFGAFYNDRIAEIKRRYGG
jgi:hypothetical protein